MWNWSFNTPCKSLKGILVLCEEEKSYTRDTSKFYNLGIQKVSVTVEGKPNQLYSQGMRSFEYYDEACKYFAEGRLANEVQAQLQLYDVSFGEYLVNKYALWLDFRMTDEKELHRMGRRIENALEGVTLQIEKKAESAGALNAYIYLIMDAQLNSLVHMFLLYIRIKMFMKKSHTALFLAPTGVGETHLALSLLENEYRNHFDFIVIICPTLAHNETYKSRSWIWNDPEVTPIEPDNNLYYLIEKISKLLAGSKTLFLIDDIITYEALNKRRQPLLELVISGRHRAHSLWLLTQSYTAIPNNIRRQAKMLYVWYTKTRTDLNTIYEENDIIETGESARVKAQLKLGKHTCLIIRMEHPRAYMIH